VEALAASNLWPGIEAFGTQDFGQPDRRLADKGPFDSLAWIEIEHQRIGPLDVVDCRAPGMELNCADLHEAEQAAPVGAAPRGRT
jgi:hypothetical protein